MILKRLQNTIRLVVVLVLAALPAQRAAAQGRYTNPVLFSDYSDPDVTCVDGEYWMTASSFNCVPGLQILHSTDLVDWEIAGAALPADSPYWDGALASPDHGNGVWAPSIRFRESDGRFYIFWGDPDRGIFQVSAEDPRGRWSSPVCVIPGRGLIDPCPLFDDDGRVYLVHAWAGSRAGFKSVLNVCELDASCTRAVGEQVLVFDGNKNGNLTVEGPKFYKHGGRYWIFAPAGGVKDGWQLALRADTPYGPYEWRRVCEAADAADAAAGRAAPTRGPHQGGWVADAAGRYWFLHFEDRHAWGRVVHLQPMSWTADGWCIIGTDVDGDGIGEPVSSFDLPAAFEEAQNTYLRANSGAGDQKKAQNTGFRAYYDAESQEQAQNQRFCASSNGLFTPVGAAETRTGFSGTSIPLNWQWHGSPEVDWAMPDPAGGCLRLNCLVHEEGWRNLWDTPNLLMEKTVGPTMELTAELVFRPAYEGDRAGLVVMGLDYSTLELFFDGQQVYLQRRACADADSGTPERVTDALPLDPVLSESGKPYCTVYLRVNIHNQAAETAKGAASSRQEVWPPVVECDFSYSLDGRRFRPLGAAFTAREGKWIGARAGFFATADIKKNDGGSVEIR